MKLVFICVMMHMPQRSNEISEEDEPSEDDGESKAIEKNKVFKVVISTKSLWTVQCIFMIHWVVHDFFKVGWLEKSFSELPKFFKDFQYSNHGTVIAWKHEESMSSPKVTERMEALARNYIRGHFTIDNHVATYYGSFSAIGHDAYWSSPSFIMKSNEFYCRLNRSRTTKISNEMDRGTAVYKQACGLCR
ncbi:hypothetical protein H5410_037421 [Solanum commersonii]|uniref:Uncharacterized protein n=1 Tax=Solanum commersonii TaxID=4109 RepID=A0A9J5Y7S7_SOLCO|nr:hypothetical protein H5410_037421 [Solanum commersonii]